MAEFDVLIVGGGFSGTVLAIQLLRRSSSLSVGVVEPGSLPGRGVAYSSTHRFHLLNVPAGEMSALPDVPDDFLNYARIHFDAGVKERSFPPRSVYGSYVGTLLEKTLVERGRERFQWLQDRAMSLRRRRGRLAVQMQHGPEIIARAVILATGNFPPGNPRVPGLERPGRAYFPFPWSPSVLENLPTAGGVLLLGSGLTAVDLIMALKSKGYRGTIHVLSRKGLFPQARRQFRPVEPWPLYWNEKSPRTVRGLMRLIRQQARAAAEKGIDWRAVIDCLRPVSTAIWQSFPTEEQRRFLRHVRPYWDVHRHRVAPEIADVLADMRAEGQVRLEIGVLTRYCERADGAEIHYWDRTSGAQKVVDVARVINCTGSESDCRRIDDSLIVSLFVQGLARPDPLFLGLDVDERGSLVDHRERSSHQLYAIGPPRKGCAWETTTVADIRLQAIEIADHLAGQLERTSKRPDTLKTAV